MVETMLIQGVINTFCKGVDNKLYLKAHSLITTDQLNHIAYGMKVASSSVKCGYGHERVNFVYSPLS